LQASVRGRLNAPIDFDGSFCFGFVQDDFKINESKIFNLTVSKMKVEQVPKMKVSRSGQSHSSRTVASVVVSDLFNFYFPLTFKN
jgi:hypothetical protein